MPVCLSHHAEFLETWFYYFYQKTNCNIDFFLKKRGPSGMTMLILSSSAAIGPLGMWEMNLTLKGGWKKAGLSSFCNLKNLNVPEVLPGGLPRYEQFLWSGNYSRNEDLCNVLR